SELHEKFARASLEAKRIVNMLAMAECEIFVKPEDLDQHPYLLNVANGTVDLRTGELRPHDPEQFLTKLADFEYDPGAQCPLFLNTLTRLMGGGPDASEVDVERADRLISHLQKAFGYSATGGTAEKVVFVAHGGGNNGKTTILTTISRVLGDSSS